jgi:hypothetical protein
LCREVQLRNTTDSRLTKIFTIALVNITLGISSSILETKATETMERRTNLSLREKLGVQAVNFYQVTVKRKLLEEPKRRGSNSTHSTDEEDESHLDQQSPTRSLQLTSSYEGYTLGDHEEYLHILTEKNGCRYCDVSHYFGVQSSIPKLVKDYISPLSQDQLKQLYFGIVPSMNDSLEKEPLPVRTLCLRIRPDIESGVVMNVVQSVFEGYQSNIKSIVLKRQGGHFQCAVDHDSAPFFIDAQLCTTKSENKERQLVLRIHHVQDHAEALVEVGHLATERKASDEESPSFAINIHLKEASSLLQLISAQKHNAHSYFDADDCASLQATPKETSLFLQDNYHEEKSVNAGGTSSEHVFPALSSQDFSILQSSLPHCLLLWEGISHHHSNCAFHTLIDVHLGTCLDTLYLSQIRQLSRETMLERLRMVKTEVDENTQKAEEEYSNFTELLESTFKHYSIDFPETIPPRMSLTIFPPSKSPPGFSIAAAMASNGVVVDPGNPAAAADEAARKVYAAFSALDDKEQRRYLRKINKEMITRGAEIIVHYQELIDQIEDLKLPSVVAAAKGFCSFARQAVNHKGRVERFLTSKVPLLELKILSGSCFITATCMLLVGEGLFPKTFLFDLRAVEFVVPSPGCVQVVSDASGEILHRFRSSMDASKVKMFLDTLKSQWRSF